MLKTGYSLNCIICNKSFYVSMWRLKRGDAKYCSKKCHYIHLETLMRGNKSGFIKGFVPWNKGNGEYIKGEKHWNWQGGKTSINMKIRNSLEYEEWRKAVFERDLYTCQDCEEIGGRLEADHVKSFSQYPELRLDIDNGRTLCVDCHRKTDTYGWRANFKGGEKHE